MEQRLVQKRQIVDFFLKKDILLSLDVLENLNEKNIEHVFGLITDKIKSNNFLFLNKDLNDALQNISHLDINWQDLEKSKALLEKGRDNKIYNQFIQFINTQKQYYPHLPH